MANICPVCGEKIRFLSDGNFPLEGIEVHTRCMVEFNKNPDKYGGKAKTETLTKNEKETVEQRKQRRNEQQQKIEDQSVHVISFDMPFGDMVSFMVKWALASIPAFIILAIIGGIFFAIFTAIFVSTR